MHKKINVRMYNVEVDSQGGNMRFYVVTIQQGQSCKILSLGSQKFKNFACCWGCVSVFENTSKNLTLKFILPLEVPATLLSG